MTTNIDIDAIDTDLTEGELRTIYIFLSNFFIGLLKPVKKSDLERYVKNMTAINIQPYINQIPTRFKVILFDMAKNNKDLIKNFLTGKTIIEEAKKNRPDLYSILITPRGRTWIDRFMEYVQKLIF